MCLHTIYHTALTQKTRLLFDTMRHPKACLGHFHPHRVNKELHLRGKQFNTAPEFPPPTLAIPHNIPPDFPQSTILAV